MEIEPVTLDDEGLDDERLNQILQAVDDRDHLRQPSQEDPR